MSGGTYADLIIINAKVITEDSNNRVVEAIAVNNGRIMKLGSSNEIEIYANKDTKILNLKGQIVLPGLIDAHMHADLYSANTQLNLDLRIPPNKSLEEIKEKLKSRVRKTPKGEWIIAQVRFETQPIPSKEELDALSPENPLVIGITGHRLLLNSKALEMAEGGSITKHHPTKEELHKLAPGGRIERDPATGEPTGITDDCYNYIFLKCPYPYKQLKNAIKNTLDELVRYGITSIHEFYGWTESSRIYQELYEDGELPLRVQMVPTVWGLGSSISLDCILKLGLKTGFGNDWIKFGSVKIFVDAWHLPEYIKMRLTQEKLDELVFLAHEADIRVIMHAVSRKGTKMALNSIEAAIKKLQKMNHRHRIEHFGSMSPLDYSDLEKVKRLAIVPCPQPYFSYYGESRKTRKGLQYYFGGVLREEGPGLGPFLFGTFIHEGLIVPGTSDCTGTGEPKALNPWWCIWCAVTRKNYKGKLILPKEKITVMEGIRAYTKHSAYVGFEEEVKGSIEEGKLADFVVLSEDPLTMPVERIKDIKVKMTIVNGKIVHERTQD